MFDWLRRLFPDRPAATAPMREPATMRPRMAAPPPPPRERDAATALAEAEARMARLPPEKAQLIRAAQAIHRARQSVLAELSDEERAKLRRVATRALLGG